MAREILLDCDPGIDDAVALLLAHGHPGLDLVAVTTVHGNRPVAVTTRNALAVATVGGITGVPFAAGCDRPLAGPPPRGDDPRRAGLHGRNGLGDLPLPPPGLGLDPRHAVELIADTVRAAGPGEVTLVGVGPLTNLATAVREEPAVVGRVREVVLMGGPGRGAGGPGAEFNVRADPDAARVVLEAGWDVTTVGLDVTRRARATPAVEQRIRSLGTGPAAFVAELLRSSRAAQRAVRGLEDPPVHDPCAVARVLDPRVVRVAGPGRTTPAGGRVRSAVDLDPEGLWSLLADALAAPGGAAAPA